MPVTPPNRKRRIRPWVLVIPTILLVMWVASGIRVGFTWDSVEEALHVQNKVRYSQLACLGMIVVAIVAVWRIFRTKDPKDND